MWDFEVTFFQPRLGGEEGERWPGFWIGRAPKQAVPTRRRDALWVYVRLESVAPVASRAVEQLAEQAAQHYFQTKGSVTWALRQSIEAVHQRLLQANRRLSARGYTLHGQLMLAVWRGSQLYVAWSGPWFVGLFEDQGRETWYLPEGEGVLGLDEEVSIRFAQATFRLPVGLLAASNLAGWREEDGHRLLSEPEATLRDWLARSPKPRFGLLAYWKPGAYEIEKKYIPLDVPVEFGLPEPAISPRTERVPKEETRVEGEPISDARPEPGPPLEKASPQASVEKVTAPAPPRPKRIQRQGRASRERREVPHPSRLSLPEEPPRPRLLTRLGQNMARSLALLLRWQVPTRPIALLSVLLPLVVLGLTLGQYLYQGRRLRHQQWLALAYEQAREAMSLPDPYQRGPAMEKALETLRKAETYGRTSDSETLRREMQQWLDRWEGIRRLDFQPALTAELPPDVQVQRLLPGTRGLYALDITRDLIWYFAQPENMDTVLFEHEPNFQCSGSRSYGGLRLGPLVDMVTVPGQPFPFEVAAFDSQGQWVTCGLDTPPQAHLLPMPTTRWGEIYRVRVFQEDAYILDRKTNNVFVINLARPQAAVPKAVFPPGAGPDLSQVRDFALLRGEIFFLMVDGQVLHCTFQLGETSASQCFPLDYQDRRPEREEALSVLPNAEFLAIELYTGPEPGLLLFDARAQAIYRFTLKLRFVEQYRPTQPWPYPPQAFMVTDLLFNEPYLFVMAGPEIYAAPLP